jgi:hypothetical protein
MNSFTSNNTIPFIIKELKPLLVNNKRFQNQGRSFSNGQNGSEVNLPNIAVTNSSTILHIKFEIVMTPGPVTLLSLVSNKPNFNGQYGYILAIQVEGNGNLNLKTEQDQWSIPNSLITDNKPHVIDTLVQNTTVTTYLDNLKINTHAIKSSIYTGASFNLNKINLGANFGYGMNGGKQSFSNIQIGY